MRALTIRPEWAWLIAHGHKTIENRSWQTAYRGPIAIHAGKRSDPAAKALCETLGIQLPDQVPAGEFIAVVDLVDIVPLDAVASDPFAVGPFCWKLANPRLIVPGQTYVGRLGLFTAPPDLRMEPDC